MARAKGETLALLLPHLQQREGVTASQAGALIGVHRDDAYSRLAKLEKRGDVHGAIFSGGVRHYFATRELAAAWRVEGVADAMGMQSLSVVAPRKRPAASVLAGDAVETERTKYTRDTTVRANNRIEAAPSLPADPRWPSFSSTRPGQNPDTGR